MVVQSVQNYIYTQEKKWLQRLQPFLQGKILKVGNGLGYMTSFIEEVNSNLTVIDIHVNEYAINKNKVMLYDGEHFPFDDKSFDCVVCTFVLHHTSNPIQILNEMKRVGKRVIILDETYRNIFSKLDLVYRDIYINSLAGQTSKIHWNSYFKDKDFMKAIEDAGLSVVHHLKEKKRSYFKELYILE